MVNKDNFEIVWKLAIVGLLVYFIFFHVPEQRKQDREYWEHANFKTDTLNVQVNYDSIPTPIFKYPVPPKLVINYIDSTRTEHIHIDMSDSLIQVTDSLKKEIYRISTQYLKLHPTSPKLIYAQFQRDSLRLDLLNIAGSISSQLFLVDYENFRYQYKDNQFRAEKLSSKKFKQDWYVYGGYDLAQTNFLLSTEYSLYKQRYKLQGFTDLYISNEPRLFLGAKLGYKLR